MRINVKLFAILRDQAGVSECRLDLPEGSTVGAASRAIVQMFPAMEAQSRFAAYAVNREYAGTPTVLHDGDELALIPPVSGG